MQKEIKVECIFCKQDFKYEQIERHANYCSMGFGTIEQVKERLKRAIQEKEAMEVEEVKLKKEVIWEQAVV